MRRFPRSRGRSPQTAKHWGDASVVDATLTSAESTAFWAISPADVSGFDEFTLLRSQLLFNARQEATSTTGGRVACGVIVASGDPDVATVPTVFADPATDGDADWIIRVCYPLAPGLAAGDFASVIDWLHQSKAKRRIATGEGLLVVYENDTDVEFSVALDYRFLIQSK